MASPTVIDSTSQFQTLISSNTCVVVDFHATWCGPCKAIAPIFNQLAAAETKPGRMAFCKVDVDQQSDIARTYSVSAMPTFLIFKNGKVIDTIQGADPSSLRSAVSRASSDAARGAAKSPAVFQSKGRTLGDSKTPSTTAATQSWIPQFQFGGAGPRNGLVDTLIRAIGLYFTTLFAFDSYAAGAASPFNASAGAR